MTCKKRYHAEKNPLHVEISFNFLYVFLNVRAETGAVAMLSLLSEPLACLTFRNAL